MEFSVGWLGGGYAGDVAQGVSGRPGWACGGAGRARMKAPGDMGCGREGQQARAAQRRLWRAAHAGSMAREVVVGGVVHGPIERIKSFCVACRRKSSVGL